MAEMEIFLHHKKRCPVCNDYLQIIVEKPVAKWKGGNCVTTIPTVWSCIGVGCPHKERGKDVTSIVRFNPREAE